MSATEDMNVAAGPARIQRRTLAKGAAWAVPAVAIASAAPAHAASGTVTFTNQNLACKLPGASCENETGVKKGYRVAMTVCNTVSGNPGNVTVTFPATVTGLLCGVSKTWTIKPNPLVLTQTGCSTVVFSLDGEPDSANCAISGSTTFTWSAQNGLTGSGTMSFSAAATPPCTNCNPVPPAAAPAVAPAGLDVDSSTTTVETSTTTVETSTTTVETSTTTVETSTTTVETSTTTI